MSSWNEAQTDTERGGESCNTPLANSNSQTPLLETGGEDTVHLSLGVVWDDSKPFFEFLEECKLRAQGNGEMVVDAFNGVLMGIYPNGRGSGGGKGIFFRYLLDIGGVSFSLASQEQPKGETPNVFVNIGSLALMERGGLEPIFDQVKDILVRLGCRLMWDKLSRLDVCADLPEVDIEEFIKLELAGQRAIRASYAGIHKEGLSWTGLTYGKGKIVLRIYDKELESRHNMHKRPVLIERRWGGQVETATRVEFQVRREGLKELQISSVADYLEKRQDLIAYLTEKWARFTMRLNERTNIVRAPLHPLWEKTIKAFKAWAGRGVPLERNMKRSRPDTEALLRQSVGCLISRAIAMCPDESMSRSQIIESLMLALEEHAEQDIYLAEKVEKKRLQYLANFGPQGMCVLSSHYKASST